MAIGLVSLSLDRLLVEDHIDRMDSEGFLNLIIKLENLQRKTVDRGKPEAFGKWAIDHILAEKLAFAVMPWLRECSKSWAEKDSDDNEDLFDDIDKEIPFNDFLIFLRRLQRQYYYKKRHYESKVTSQKEPEPAAVKSKADEPKKKKPAKKFTPPGWSCPFCQETSFYHLAEECPAFLKLITGDKVRAIKKQQVSKLLKVIAYCERLHTKKV